jgi:hypothetical protein
MTCPIDLRRLYRDRRVIPFVGAGASMSVSWGPVGILRAPRPSFFDVLFVEPHSWHAPPFLVAGKREMSGIVPGAAANAQSLHSGSSLASPLSSPPKALRLRVAEAGCRCQGSKNFPQNSAFFSCERINLSRATSVNRLNGAMRHEALMSRQWSPPDDCRCVRQMRAISFLVLPLRVIPQSLIRCSSFCSTRCRIGDV